MKIFTILLICITLAGNFSCAQASSHLDSLKNDLSASNADTTRLSILTKIASAFYKLSAFDSVIEYASRGLNLARKINDKKMIATYYTWLGIGNHFKGNFDIELENYLAALKINEETGNKKSVSINLTNIGNIYYESKNDYANALDYYFRSLALKKELNDQPGMAAVAAKVSAIWETCTL